MDTNFTPRVSSHRSVSLAPRPVVLVAFSDVEFRRRVSRQLEGLGCLVVGASDASTVAAFILGHPGLIHHVFVDRGLCGGATRIIKFLRDHGYEGQIIFLDDVVSPDAVLLELEGCGALVVPQFDLMHQLGSLLASDAGADAIHGD